MTRTTDTQHHETHAAETILGPGMMPVLHTPHPPLSETTACTPLLTLMEVQNAT